MNNQSIKGGVTITLTAEQVKNANEFLGRINWAHLQEDCEPPGFDIVISVAGPFGQRAKILCGKQSIDIGDVAVEPRPEWCF